VRQNPATNQPCPGFRRLHPGYRLVAGCGRELNYVHPAKSKIEAHMEIRGNVGASPLSRAAGAETGKRGKLFERSEFLPRRFWTTANGVVSATRLPFLLILFFGQAKKRYPPQGVKNYRENSLTWWGHK